MTPLRTRRYEPEDAAAIEQLNQRLGAADVPHRVYPERRSTDSSEGPVRSRLFVACDDEGVHGGVWLQEHEFWVAGKPISAGWVKYPVSESLVDRRYGGVPGGLILRLLKEQPLLMALGMGGWDTPLARLLARIGWKGWAVPFYFSLVRPGRALRELAGGERTPVRRAAVWVAGASGAGWVGSRAITLWRAARRRRGTSGYTAHVVDRFGEWVDAIWAGARAECSFAAVRDGGTLPVMFQRPRSLIRLRVQHGGADVGWACVTVEDLHDDPHPRFGRQVVGLLADGLALPGHTAGVAHAAIRHLAAAGVDLIISNQQHAAWRRALHDLGFLRGPSNFICFASPRAAPLVAPGGDGGDGVHLNRGDCDGPAWR